MDSKKTPRLDFYTIVIAFAACCVIGYVVERLWCLVQLGYLESRKSLVYGPLSVAYGLGGLALTASLYRFRELAFWKVFIIAFVVGSIVEYVCSFGQELFFDSVSWDYSDMPFNINGRICLLYSLFWGALGIFWVKFALPVMLLVSEWARRGWPRLLVWAFVAFFVFDCFMSGAAAARMDERAHGLAPSNWFEELLDERFPDERMRAIYANSREAPQK